MAETAAPASDQQQQQQPGNAVSNDALLRIQQETQRLKKRLSSDDGGIGLQGSGSGGEGFGLELTEEQYQTQTQALTQQPSSPVSPGHSEKSNTPLTSTRPLIIESSLSQRIEDPVPIHHMSAHLRSEHEAFKAKLIDDVLGENSNDKVPMEKVVMLIWQFRDDPQVVKFMTRFVSKFSGSRHVFDGIEFYLPQLAHMIIHLEAEWDDAILERFALVISQQSLHFALQLNWILHGAIEDYQPELPSGDVNPNYNFLFYSRCIKLQTNIERCVVYRRARTIEFQRLYEQGKITEAEYQAMEQADRRFNALQIIGLSEESGPSQVFGGFLKYKRKIRTACYKTKSWKMRYFAIELRMLNCYDTKDGRLIRSMPLEGADIHKNNRSKYPFAFCVINRNFDFRLIAKSEEDMNAWIKSLTEESQNANDIFGRKPNQSMSQSAHGRVKRVLDDMTPGQRARYDFFRDERDFVRRLTDIAEQLRFKDRDERKKLAPQLLQEMNIPPCVYLPLCNSTDIWRRVTTTLYKDTRVFNTKERCPVIMYFLTARGELPVRRKNGFKDANLDVVEYMYNKFDATDGTTVIHEEDGDDEFVNGHQPSAMPEPDAEPARQTNEPSEVETAATGDSEMGLNKEASIRLSEEDKSKTYNKGTSSVWHDSYQNEDRHEGRMSNRHLQRFLKDSWVSVPRKLASRLDSRRSSAMDNVVNLNSVPIIEGGERGRDPDDISLSSEVSIGRSSIVINNDQIVLGDLDEGGIDIDSINRAKEIVSGGESWAEKSFRMLKDNQNKKQTGQLEVSSLMSKSNDDLRQEVFVMQMIHYYKSVFANAKLPLWLKTYRILSTSSTTGLIEVLVDATSIHGLKSSPGYPEEGGLRRYFENVYGKPDSESFKAAQTNFMQSLAAYSIVSYLLGLKDRHNGNIMIDTRGHLIFIDFGFAMGMAPGHEFSFEKAPFKLTPEYVEVMDGVGSDCYKEFQRLFVEGFRHARDNSQIALGLVEIMMYKSNYPCFSGSRYGNGKALRRFEDRLMLRVPDANIKQRALQLIESARTSKGTYLYDAFQQWSNGYLI